jgi:plastocyanin
MTDRYRIRAIAAAAVVSIGLVAAACTTSPAPSAEPSTGQGPQIAQQTAPQSTAPQLAIIPTPPAAAPGSFAVPVPGPNLLATDWASHLGIIVSAMLPATQRPILSPKAGDLWFFSNASTTWGATNTRNSVWVINAKTKQTVAEVAPFDGQGYSSHGIAVSADGKYVYLPMLGQNNHIDVLDGRTLEVVQTVTTLGRNHHQKLWQDPTTGKSLIIGEDFNWNYTGSGVYVLDPSENNAVVGGMSNGDFEGNPYYDTPAPDGSFIVVTVPAATSALRATMDGALVKVDPKTWKITGAAVMKDPLWAEVTLDKKYAYVTSGGTSTLHKINLDTMKDEGSIITGPGPWGARLSYDNTKLYTADKGEGPGYNQMGRTATIVDLQTMAVSNVVPIGITTDHAILSPDGKEVWFTSNADHNIHVMDTATEKITTVIQDPADGDIHGGVFVHYTDDGSGGVVGEVVADYSGLHGSALAAQMEYASEPAVTLAIGSSGFVQKSVSVQPGQAVRLTIKDTTSTSGGKLTFESRDLGIPQMTLGPGESQVIQWTAPGAPADFTANTSKGPNTSMTISIKPAQAAGTNTIADAGAPRAINIQTQSNTFSITSLTAKAGDTLRFTIKNGDDEKHNLVGQAGLDLVSPDFPAGATTSYDWTVPNTPGTYKVICTYHPEMVITFDIQP